jgi:hypothetical protein
MALNNFVTLGESGGTAYPLTDQGRTFSMARDERSVPVSLANGIIKKYFMAVKYTFNLSWTFLPSASTQTYDQKYARDKIKELSDYISGPLTLTLQRTAGGSPVGATTSYEVWVEGYSEEIVRRDYTNNTIWYEVQLDLKEQ